MVHTDGFEADNNFQRIESGTDSEGEPEDVHVCGIVSFGASQRDMQILLWIYSSYTIPTLWENAHSYKIILIAAHTNTMRLI